MLSAYWLRSQDLMPSAFSSLPRSVERLQRVSFQTPLARVRLAGQSSVMFASRYPLSMSAGVSESPRSFMVSKMV